MWRLSRYNGNLRFFFGLRSLLAKSSNRRVICLSPYRGRNQASFLVIQLRYLKSFQKGYRLGP